MKKTALFIVIIALLAAAYFMFGGNHQKGPPAGAMGMAVPVKVRTLQPQKAQVWSNFSGKLVAVDSVDVRPQVGGKIQEVRFQDGATVKQGDVLFVIEPEFYEAAVERAQSALASAQTQAALAARDLSRTQGLIRSGFVTKQQVDQSNNNKRVADAAVKSATADVKQAKINYDYAFVKAPIGGRISRAELTVGNLVQAGAGAPVLTRIVSNAGIYADFEVDTQTYLQAAGQGSADAQAQIPVIITLRDDPSARTFEGRIRSFDNQIDPATGTIRARAYFDNAQELLIPGMFVSVRMGSLNAQDTLVVPDVAISTDQDRKFVYVVEDNKAIYRPITLGPTADGGRIVLSGLKAGDRVIVDGMQHVMMPGAPVAPTEEEQAQVAPAQSENSAEKPEVIPGASKDDAVFQPAADSKKENTDQQSAPNSEPADAPNSDAGKQ